jgi:hypothetical protein
MARAVLIPYSVGSKPAVVTAANFLAKKWLLGGALVSSTTADERPRVRREATREALFEATAQIMLDEGYAAA